MKYSRLVTEHFQRSFINEEYLLLTPFTYKDLNDITTMRQKETIVYSFKKPKMSNLGRTYKSYLKKANFNLKRA